MWFEYTRVTEHYLVLTKLVHSTFCSREEEKEAKYLVVAGKAAQGKHAKTLSRNFAHGDVVSELA